MATSKLAILKALLSGEVVQLLVKSRIDNIFMTDGTTTLADKLQEMVNAVNARAKITDVDEAMAQLKGDLDKLPSTSVNPYKLILNGVEYDGSAEVTINIEGDGNASGEEVLSDNMFDKTQITSGYVIYRSSSSGHTPTEQTNAFYSYVELRGAGTYRYKIPWDFIGSEAYAKRVPLAKADQSFLKNLTGTYTASDDVYAYDMEVTISETDIAEGACYLVFDGYEPYLDTLMVVKDIDYPEVYIPYGYITIEPTSTNLHNTLLGKTAIFLGDSICAGTTVGEDIPEHGYGWGGLIGVANSMTWDNEGQNGAVLTSGIDGANRIVSNQVDTAYAKYRSADFVLFEGGTNDADYLKNDSSKLGTIASNYTTFDNTTFTGAFESLILKILTTYPTSKVGYIIPQKMGLGLFDSENSARRRFFDRAIEVCEKWGIPYIDLWNENPMNPELSIYYDKTLDETGNISGGKYYIDGQHLTLKGYKKITPQIESFMRRI